MRVNQSAESTGSYTDSGHRCTNAKVPSAAVTDRRVTEAVPGGRPTQLEGAVLARSGPISLWPDALDHSCVMCVTLPDPRRGSPVRRGVVAPPTLRGEAS